MKKLIFLLALAAVFIFDIQAQAFQKGDKFLSLGTGGSNFWYFVEDFTGTYSPASFQLIFQGEFSIHEYVGIGFTTGMGGRSGAFTMPFGAIANFHFYQFIADRVEKDIHSDKMDVYGGVNVGSGFAIFTSSSSTAAAIAFFGPQLGIRYFFKPNIAVNGEVGYGQSWVNAGISFKLGK